MSPEVLRELTFDAERHEYRVDGLVVPSVTQVLGATILARLYEGVPLDVLDAKARIGTHVHTAVRLDNQGRLDEDHFNEEFPTLAGYLRAWREWRNTTEFYPVLSEKPLAHPTLSFAGTFDVLGRLPIEDQSTGEHSWAVVDVKTSAIAARGGQWQTAAYVKLLVDTEGPVLNLPHPSRIRRYCLVLRPDGTYDVHGYNEPHYRWTKDWEQFASALLVFRLQQGVTR